MSKKARALAPNGGVTEHDVLDGATKDINGTYAGNPPIVNPGNFDKGRDDKEDKEDNELSD